MAGYRNQLVLTATAATSQQTSADFESGGYRSAYFFLNITANPGGAETLTFALQAKSPVDGTYRTVTAMTASTAATNGLFPFIISRGSAETSAVSNFEVQSIPLPGTWRVIVLHSSTGAWTYTVRAELFDKDR